MDIELEIDDVIYGFNLDMDVLRNAEKHSGITVFDFLLNETRSIGFVQGILCAGLEYAGYKFASDDHFVESGRVLKNPSQVLTVASIIIEAFNPELKTDEVTNTEKKKKPLIGWMSKG